jgi:hypothetical protein
MVEHSHVCQRQSVVSWRNAETIGSFLGRYRHLQAIDGISDPDLTGQTRGFPAMLQAFQQANFVLAHGWELRGKSGIHVDVARSAGTTAATDRKQVTDATVTDCLHDRAVPASFE